MRAPALLPFGLLTCCGWLLAPVNSIHPECRFHLEIQEEETRCAELLGPQTENYKACPGVWDNITCWPPADLSETVTVPCPKVFSNFYSKPRNISKNCTSDGWSEMFLDFIDACGFHDPEDESKIMFYVLVKATYTLSYSVSLISLTTGSIILCLFRRLHCTRNHIHLNLFLSFILRAVSVLVKDDVLYSSSGWLQAESGALPVLRHVQLLLAAGRGAAPACPPGGHVPRLLLHSLPPDRMGCPHHLHGGVGRHQALLRGHGVNFVLFVSIIRILLQKLTSPGVGGNDQSQYKRLTKSTLLLIPLFGVHYVVFVVFPIGISSTYQILLELCIGSFQGPVVAVLYCFLNSEVQGELRRKWRGLCQRQPTCRDRRLHGSSSWRNSSESALPCPRGSCAPSFLQTETSVI